MTGSRSSPLALAAASHPRSQLTVAIDERSLGFWALGFGRANPNGLPAAVICSSGTAVANLLPAVVEASQSNIPLLLLTADRPFELRDTGANQTIDQVKIFGSYTRWSSDVTPPSDAFSGRLILSTIDTAIRFATAPAAAGPVHLNLQFREPLAPASAAWSPARFLQGLDDWQGSAEPYTSQVLLNPVGFLNPSRDAAAAAAGSAELKYVLQLLLQAQRGLVVVGEQNDPGSAAAAMQLAAALGWPLAADVLSGLRIGSSSSSGGLQQRQQRQQHVLVHHLDHILLDADSPGSVESWWSQLQPDVVLQMGPRVTSKRVNQFMVGTTWLVLTAPSYLSETP
jgi:isochorismate synthase/2-succinyl-5-enolpyruvyl-6-hydroxy-3-cyclohexene-1-carboxylate synthase/2-succinyl-6-hydroxy-2,4-cyclohexadiene-1-carboxylate synthase/O-succinylbenzoate synthase